mmetsp:Transcript_1282/g.1652  ORF Transcript_1282/g.1652 Transcript_1282/m.1652 type:complete len:160 (-) Transcript_1282:16-495(-)
MVIVNSGLSLTYFEYLLSLVKMYMLLMKFHYRGGNTNIMDQKRNVHGTRFFFGVYLKTSPIFWPLFNAGVMIIFPLFFPHQVNFTAPICQLSWLSSSPDYGVDYSPYLTQKQQHDIAISSTSPPRTSSSRSATAATGAAPSPPIVHAFEFGDGGEVKHL